MSTIYINGDFVLNIIGIVPVSQSLQGHLIFYTMCMKTGKQNVQKCLNSPGFLDHFKWINLKCSFTSTAKKVIIASEHVK